MTNVHQDEVYVGCTGHVVMITDGSLDVRCKENINSPLLYQSTNAFFSTGTGYNLTLVGLNTHNSNRNNVDHAFATSLDSTYSALEHKRMCSTCRLLNQQS